MIFTDNCFSIGSTHQICEDYALSSDGLIKFSVVSDGCSGSTHSDIGSRALSHALKQCVNVMGPTDIMTVPASELVTNIHDLAKSSVFFLGLGADCLHATLLFALVNTETEMVRIIMVGDGFLSIKAKSQEAVSVLKADYSKDIPMYPAYIADPLMMERFKTVSINREQKVSHDWIFGESIESLTQSDSEHVFELSIKLSDLEWLFLASDGIDTFYSDQEEVDTLDIVKQLSDIKNKRGTFISRRFNKVMKVHPGLKHGDDVSIAGISVVE